MAVEPMRFNGHHHIHHYPGLATCVRAFRPDLIHIDEEPYNLVAAQATRLAQRSGAKTLFFTWQNLDRRYPPPFSIFERYCYRHASVALAGNEDAVRVLRRKGFDKPVEVIPQFGIDPEIYRPLPRVPHEGFTVGFYGRLVEEKGIDTLIDALALLPGDVRAVILGSGDVRDALEQRASEQGVSERVSFRSALPAEEIPAFLAGIDAVVVPSRTRPNWKEQFGRVIVEAMACEVPVVGSDSGEIPNVIGDAGLVFSEGDAAALAVHLRNLRDNHTLRQQLATAGRARALARYTQRQIARSTWDVYRTVLDHSAQQE
jgi:glycosyltransferase involved in cell wall biosynthesis